MKTYTWIPAPLGEIFPDGKRWDLYQTNHPKGYLHYIGRVCRNDWTNVPTCYVCEVGIYNTMHNAARALIAKDNES